MRSAVSQPRRDENKAKIVQIRPNVLNIRLFWECSCEISDSLSTQTATDMIGKIKFHEKWQYVAQLALEPVIARIFSFFLLQYVQYVRHLTGPKHKAKSPV